MALTTTNLERQEDEIQVLESVFSEEFVDLRKSKENAWNVQLKVPTEICLTLRPQHSSGGGEHGHTQVDLYVKCPPSYPDQAPEFKLQQPKGITNSELCVLEDVLKRQVNNSTGEVMILEMAQTVEKFLHDHNRPEPKSFYEEMLSHKRQQEEKIELEKQRRKEEIRKKEENERKIVEEELVKRQMAYKEEMRRKKDEEKQFEDKNIVAMSPIYPIQNRRSPSSERNNNDHSTSRRHRRTSTRMAGDMEHDCQCDDHKTGLQILNFGTSKEIRPIQRGKCLGHSENGSTVYNGLDTVTGDVVAITEWVLKWRHIAKRKKEVSELDEEGNNYMKQVNSIEQEMTSLIKLHHKNLLHYLGMRSIREPGIITVQLLTENTGGGCLEVYLKKKEPLPIATLKQYTGDLLQAFEYLHNKAVVHKNLRASSVFIDRDQRVRLADFSVNKRLVELYETVEKARPGVHFTVSPQVVGRGGKKADIYQLGIMLLSLADGHKVTTIPPTIPTQLPQVFHDFLTKCLMNDERLRWTATELLSHPFIQETIPPQVSDDSASKESKNEDEIDDEDVEEDIPFITALEASGHSRLTNEFHIIKSLGKGGFGDVLKVKNKLDGRFYAIKRIPLNPKSQQFTKKITREVKLLSRLNHENVVRYYNSWIETSDEPAVSDTSSSTTHTSSVKTNSQKTTPSSDYIDFTNKNSLGLIDNIEGLAPPINNTGSIEWSMNYSYSTQKTYDDSGTDSDDSDVFGNTFLATIDDDNSIEFEGGSDEDDVKDVSLTEKYKEEEETDNVDGSLEYVQKLQYLYIQMEYCEKSTLRNCIDAGLYVDVDRTWRLFREMIEGLVHLHDQGMIHRDLKPVNIFMDSNDHVKIGDFGLATTDILVKQSALLDASKQIGNISEFHIMASSRSMSIGDGNLTGNVGTALYVSPEVMASGGKLHYDQKVDIYSLGIIFLEMCYRPLTTEMERVTILGNIRQPTVNMPNDFDMVNMAKQAHIIKWLLNHDPSKRPTSKQLLQSDCLPPPQMEEAELNEILKSTLSNPQSKSYKRIIDAMFSQPVSMFQDFTYDSDLYINKGIPHPKIALVQSSVQTSLERIFERHGAVKLTSPIMLSKFSMSRSEQYASLIDHSGGVIGLRSDLRVPFARYVARSNIQSLKRYCIDHVYHEKKFFGIYPKDIIECAFDIVTPFHFGLIPVSEVLAVVAEIVNEFPALQERNYYFRLNHTYLLKAILVHFGIAEDKHESVLLCLRDYQKKKSVRRQMLESRCGVTLNGHISDSFFTLFDCEGSYKNVNMLLKTITKSKGEASSLAKRALHELETVITYAETLGVKLEMKVTVGLIYNPQQYNGVIYQLMYEHKRKQRLVTDVLAAGGAYDHLINHFRSLCKFEKDVSTVENSPFGVGVSLAFEKIAAAVIEKLEDPLSSHDIVVCSVGHNPMWKERLNVVRDLWAAGLKAEVLYDSIQNLEDVQLYCQNLNIRFTVCLKDSDGGSVRIRWLERDKTMEKKVQTWEMVEFLQQKLQSNKADTTDVHTTSQNYSSKSSGMHTNTPTDSHQSNTSNGPGFNFHFLLQDMKPPTNTRRRYETQIFGKVSAAWPWLPGKSLDVIVASLDHSTLKILAAYLELHEDEQEFNDSISSVLDKQQRNKKYLVKIIDQIFELKFEKMCPFLVIYGIKDDSMKLLT